MSDSGEQQSLHPDIDLAKRKKAVSKQASKTAVFSIASNLLLAAIKLVSGIFGASFALIADALESVNDAFSSLIVLWGFRYSKKPADDNHPYGHGKVEPLITFVVVVFMLSSAFFITWKAIHNIQTSHPNPKWWTMVILVGIILWKEYSYRRVRRSGDEMNSASLIADAWHHRSDAFTSLLALLGIGFATAMGEGYSAADDWAALGAAGLILFNCYLIFRPALSEVMDEHVHKEMEEEVRRISQTIPGVILTEKCFIRKAGMFFQVDLHVVVDGNLTVEEGHAISHLLKDTVMLQIESVDHMLIHVEPHTVISNDVDSGRNKID